MNKVSQTLINNLLRKWSNALNTSSNASKNAQNIAENLPITIHNVYKTSLTNPSKILQTKRTFLFGRKKPIPEDLKYDWEYRFHHWIGFAAFFSVGALTAWTERAEEMKKKRIEKRRSLLDEKVVEHQVVREVFSRLPLRMMSKVFGFLTSCHIPQWARVPIYSGYSAVYGCNLEEIAQPLDSFENFRAFFTRELKEGARPIDAFDIVSPVDARILNFGQVHSDTLEQVKGIDYSLFAFFGKKYEELERLVVAGDVTEAPTKLFHCIFYLAPGDYHQFHSPADWTIQMRRHFPGYLFPVAPISTNYVKGLFNLNERVVLFGKWKHGFFSYTPVGATNVGSILINFDKDLLTNQFPQPRQEYFDLPFTNQSSQGITIKKGDPIGCFQTGSTIVLIFEAPANFDFTIQSGQTIKLGQSLGTLVNQPQQES